MKLLRRRRRAFNELVVFIIIISIKEKFLPILNMDADKEKTKGEDTFEEIKRMR